jgi:enamine deaminase RidA (YjgF/YER057c/UK114 family)
MPRPVAIIPPALRAVHDRWHFAPAVRVGGLIVVSGIIGTSPDGEAPGPVPGGALEGAAAATADPGAPLAALVAVRDPAAQFETAFAALRAILRAAGADLVDLVEITSYHVDMARHMETFMAVRARVLSPPWPAWTAVEVAGLIVPGGLVELRALAAVPD